MGKGAVEGIVTIVSLIIGVAIVAVLVSKNADTGNVLTAGGNALTTIIGAAVGPVTTNTNSQLHF
jgi:hypothetical protein